jgi:hypothetical protein
VQEAHSRGATVVDPDVISFAISMATIVTSVTVLAGVYVGAKWAIAASKRHDRGTAALGDSRLEQLQQSIDSIAVEVERITEAQRFTAKLMAERAEDPRLPR